MKQAYSKTTFAVLPGETHDQPFMDPLFGAKSETKSAELLESWLKSRL